MNHLLSFPSSNEVFVITEELLNKFKAVIPVDRLTIVPMLPDHSGVTLNSRVIAPLGGSGGTGNAGSAFDRHRAREPMSDVEKINVELLSRHMQKRVK